jgi:hypothetical protein
LRCDNHHKNAIRLDANNVSAYLPFLPLESIVERVARPRYNLRHSAAFGG